MFLEKFYNWENTIKDDIYNKEFENENIVFLGSCRAIFYGIAFEELNKMHFLEKKIGIGVVAVYLVDLINRKKSENIKTLLENADYIVCEQIRGYSFLNTSETCEENIFNTFKLKPNVVVLQIPNLDLKYYYKDLLSQEQNISEKNTLESIKEIKLNNLKRSLNHFKKYNFENSAEFIEKNINTKRLFVTYNHPCTCTLLEVLKEIVYKIFGKKIPESISQELQKIVVFQNTTEFEEIDYQTGISREIN